MKMQGYHNENYAGNSREILKSQKEPRTSRWQAHCILGSILEHLHLSLPRQSHLKTLLHNNKLLIKNYYYYFNYLQYNKNK